MDGDGFFDAYIREFGSDSYGYRIDAVRLKEGAPWYMPQAPPESHNVEIVGPDFFDPYH